ncbi:MAG: hypothetical protein ACYCVN_12410 [Acidimicrobiales bacterium]
MTVADLSVQAPGRPDQPDRADVAGDAQAYALAEPAAQGVSLPTVIGLVRSAAAIVAQIIGASYPERPGIGTMTDEEAEGIATALVSWSTHNPALRVALERSDALAVAFYMAGWTGRTVTDIAQVRRERKANATDRGEAQIDRPDPPHGAGPGEPRNPFGSDAGWSGPDSGVGP